MDFSTPIFSKSIRQITYTDIVTYFNNPQKENDLLEFKSFPALGNIQDKMSSLFKSVCAFLNSSGGLIIWGAPIGATQSGIKEKIFQGQLTNLDPTIEKDRLVSQISSNIMPLASSFNLELLEDQHGNKICIIEVTKSNYSPHQFDGTYYMRLDGQSRPAPHHYLEALFKRISYPNIEGYIKFDQIITEEVPVSRLINKTFYTVEITAAIFNFSKLQNEENIFFTLESDLATIKRNLDEELNSLLIYSANGHSITKRDALSVLAYGNPYRFTVGFKVDPHQANNNGNTIVFRLFFGGKGSPLKQSIYKINISNFRNEPDTNKLIIEMRENESIFEYVENQGITKEEQLTHFLGR